MLSYNGQIKYLRILLRVLSHFSRAFWPQKSSSSAINRSKMARALLRLTKSSGEPVVSNNCSLIFTSSSATERLSCTLPNVSRFHYFKHNLRRFRYIWPKVMCKKFYFFCFCKRKVETWCVTHYRDRDMSYYKITIK